jgi:hypothetical protein
MAPKGGGFFGAFSDALGGIDHSALDCATDRGIVEIEEVAADQAPRT